MSYIAHYNRKVIRSDLCQTIRLLTALYCLNLCTLLMATLFRTKKCCSCVAIIALTVITSTSLAVEFAGGSGQANDPYQIATAEQLVSIGSEPNMLDNHFLLVNDIDLDPNLPGGCVFTKAVIAHGQVPVGRSQWHVFFGSFDGNGHSIKNLTIYGTGDSLGLFGSIGGGVRIQNLGLENVLIIGTHNLYNLGGLAGYSRSGSINNCYVTGSISGGDNCEFIGGLAGSVVAGTITNCYTNVDVSAGEDAHNLGGLVGYFATGRIVNCYATGGVSGGLYSENLAGLVGVNGSNISDCYAAGNVSGGEDSNDLGGLVGWNWLQSSINNCYFITPFDGGGPDNGVGVSLTEQQMKQQASFIDWDFDYTWIISEGSSYLALRPDAPEPPKPSPPDLSLCTRVDIQYYFSTLDIVCSRPAERNLLNPEEIEYLQSLKIITSTDEDAIEALAYDLSLGSYRGTGGTIRLLPTAYFTCYHNDELLASFTYFVVCLATEEGHWFDYDEYWPSIRILTSQIQPFRLRIDCARNLKMLRSSFSQHFWNMKTWPDPAEWCDAIVRNYQPESSNELPISSYFKCPGVSEGECHYAMNPNCRPSSLPDTVLLFETETGWNQHGGPELFTFDNHDPKGGCVLLNHGTLKFIRTNEELLNLQWK